MLEKKVDLRQKAKTTERIPASTVRVDMPGFSGTLPLSTGRVDKNPHGMSDQAAAETARILEDYQQDEVKLREQVAERAKQAVKNVQVVDIDDLPEEHRKETLEAIQEAIKTKPQKKSQPFIPRGPGISQAKMMADRVERRIDEKIKQAPEAKAAPTTTPQPTTPPEAAAGSVAPAAQTCCHCGWPVDRMDPCNPTYMDKQTFVIAVLGQMRFTKEYQLLGGKLTITFRSLTVAENDLVMEQMLHDWNAGKISGPAHSVIEATKYQLALSLESIETGIGRKKLPTFDEYETDKPKSGTVLPDIVAYVQSTAMPNESMRRIISKAYGHFIDTVSKLEAMAETPDFWQATAD